MYEGSQWGSSIPEYRLKFSFNQISIPIIKFIPSPLPQLKKGPFWWAKILSTSIDLLKYFLTIRHFVNVIWFITLERSQHLHRAKYSYFFLIVTMVGHQEIKGHFQRTGKGSECPDITYGLQWEQKCMTWHVCRQDCHNKALCGSF